MMNLSDRFQWSLVATLAFGISGVVPYTLVFLRSGTLPTELEVSIQGFLVASAVTTGFLGGVLWGYFFEDSSPMSARTRGVGIGVVVGWVSPGVSLALSAVAASPDRFVAEPLVSLLASLVVALIGISVLWWLTTPVSAVAGYALARLRTEVGKD